MFKKSEFECMKIKMSRVRYHLIVADALPKA